MSADHLSADHLGADHPRDGHPGADRPVDRRPGADPGTLLELQVGPVAHGGHCVARHEGRVVFVRHALPGEKVLARLEPGSDTDRFWRADAVEIVEASPDRVPRPCPLAGPGRCGGCDWQHATPAAQRRLKRDVVLEQLTRLGRVDLDTVPGLADLAVEAVPGDRDGLAWRTRMQFAVDSSGRAGLRRHRSHDLIPVPHCPIAHPEVDAVGVGARPWRGVATIDVVVAAPPVRDAAPAGDAPSGTDGTGGPDDGVQRLVVVEPALGAQRVSPPPLAAEAAIVLRDPEGLRRLRGRTWVAEEVTLGGVRRTFRVTGAGFWQVHPGAPAALTEAVTELAAARPGERAIDLYSGVGLFTAALALAVGESGAVLGIESDERGSADARRNLHDLPQVELATGRVEHVLPSLVAAGPWAGTDVVVLDPPRAGAGRAVMKALLAPRPRVVVYVACDPAALARDVAIAAGSGYRLAALRAFDLFPMTHHVECVAALVPVDPGVA